MNESRFKPGDVVFCDGLAWGCGTVVEANNPNVMRVDFGGQIGVRSLSITDHWRLATEEDRRGPLEPPHEPKPLCEPEEATLENLEFDVACWEQAVRTFEAGFDCSEEYTHDLFFRQCLHATLNGFARRGISVPSDLRGRIDAADRRFIELTRETAHGVWGGPCRYDPGVFWYYYRMLVK
jgi:hypothetical protein